MKDLDTAGAPMISVPAGVLKEFISPANSRTPTPPMPSSTLSSTATTHSEVAGSSPSPTIPSASSNTTGTLNTTTTNGIIKSIMPTSTSRSSPALMLPVMIPIEKTSSPSPIHMNGKGEVKDHEELKEETKKTPDHLLMNGNAGSPSPQPASTISSTSSNGNGGVKRSNEDEDGKPDLKKIRVVSSLSKDGFKNLNITVKEVNQALDLESKKFQEADKRNHQNLVTLSRIKNGIAMLAGEKLSSTESTSHSPSSAPSPSAATVQEGEDAATPDTHVQASAPTMELDSSDKENVRLTRGKESKLTKNGLKDAILRVFSENSLYSSEVGHLKQMCEKLTSTLEINMRKVAQFHKEIEDLRKVTTRLAAEHQARKGQYVAPIRIKRSVGIQAAPHIINKGIMHASVSGGNIKTISPRTPNMVLPPSVGQNLVPGSTLGFITTSSGIVKPGTLTSISGAASVLPGAAPGGLSAAVRAPNGQIMMMAPAPTMQPIARPAGAGAAAVNATTAMLPVAPGRVVRAPLGNIGSVTPQAGTVIGTQRPILIQNDKGGAATGVSPTLQAALTAGRTGGVIDLTDEDEGAKGNRNAMVPKPGTLVKVPTSATAQLVPLQAGGMGQVVLLPNTSGGQPTTALIVSQVPTGQTAENIGNPAVAQARISTVVNHTSSSSRIQGATPPAPVRTTATTPTPTTTVQPPNSMKHPAPLPKTPFQQVGGISKKLPPQPTLKLSHKDSSIVLSWTMAKTEDHEAIASYQLYAYQEGAAPPSANLWKKVGSVKALELPMACTLTQFMPGHVYHFAVRAVDTKSRLGPFSDPRSIRLDKK